MPPQMRINLPIAACFSKPRPFKTAYSRSYSAMATSASFAAGSDDVALQASLRLLLSSGGGRWEMTTSGRGIERTFRFKTFAKAWDFMTAVSLQCKIKNHHPEWSNVYNMTHIRWTTHNPKSLSAKDVELAAICDSLAKDFGEIQAAPEEDAATTELGDLTSSAAESAGDCCGKNPKSE